MNVVKYYGDTIVKVLHKTEKVNYIVKLIVSELVLVYDCVGVVTEVESWLDIKQAFEQFHL